MAEHEVRSLGSGSRAQARGGVVEPVRDELPMGMARHGWWRWSRLPGMLLAILALVTLVGLLTGTRFTAQPTVVGARLVSEADLVATAGVAQKSLFLVRPAEVERRLLQTYGCLEAVTVTCRLPDLVTIEVRERANVLVWESGGQRWWIDIAGSVLGLASQVQGLITVEDAVGSMPSPGDYVPGVPWQMARDVARHLGAAPRFYFQEHGLTLYVRVQGRDVPAYLGCEGDGATKAAVLQALVEYLENEGIPVAYLDLSHEASPVFKVIQG